MKSENKEPVNKQDRADTGSNDYNNEVASGTITESSGDNGASALRDLRRKHSSTGNRVSSSKRPLL
jgi:hypothetical protein